MNLDSLLRIKRVRYAKGCAFIAQVHREHRADNGIGGGSAKSHVIEEAIPAGVSPLRQPREGVEGATPVVTADYNVFLCDANRAPDEFDVQKNDVITVEGRAYLVVDTDKGRSNAVCLTAMCKRTG